MKSISFLLLLLLSVTYVHAQTPIPGNSIWDASGRIGIRTKDPRAYLDVGAMSPDTTSAILGRLAEGNEWGRGTYLGVQTYGTQPTGSVSFSLQHLFYNQVNSSIQFHRGPGMIGGFMSFCTYNNSEKMRITAAGTVGIGTTTTGTNMLAVEGTIAARKVKVTQQANWPDYVFDPAFQLPSLYDVENFIAVNKHLPDVPSAKEIERDGQDLGEMNRILLQKVEELTLYLIELKKENEKQMEMIRELQRSSEK